MLWLHLRLLLAHSCTVCHAMDIMSLKEPNVILLTPSVAPDHTAEEQEGTQLKREAGLLGSGGHEGTCGCLVHYVV